MFDIEAKKAEVLKNHKNWRFIRMDRNGTLYFGDHTCTRCGGKGGWEGWPGFTCYECGGSGISDREEVYKIYTPEHEEYLRQQREARAKKREAQREKEAIANRATKLKEAGFGREEDGFVIYRVVGNTFPIKDQLKSLGCRFKPSVGWYASHKLEEYECQRMTEKEVLTDSIFIEWKEKNEVEPLWVETIRRIEESPSKWIGEVGAKIVIKVHIDRVFESEYRFHEGWWGTSSSYLYLMTDENGNKFKWSTSCVYEEGTDVTFRATVKDHTEYRGIKQTVITRATRVKEDN